MAIVVLGLALIVLTLLPLLNLTADSRDNQSWNPAGEVRARIGAIRAGTGAAAIPAPPVPASGPSDSGPPSR